MPLYESCPRLDGPRTKKYRFNAILTSCRERDGEEKTYQTQKRVIAVGSWYVNDIVDPPPRAKKSRSSKKGSPAAPPPLVVIPAKYQSLFLTSDALKERVKSLERCERFALLLGKNFVSANLLYASNDVHANFAALRKFLMENLP